MFINRLADFLSHPVFQIIAFVCALVAGIVTFASHSLTLREKLRQLSSNRVRRPKARYKVVKSFAIVLNGPADYAPQIRNGFVHTLEQLLKNSRFAPVFEEVVGAAEGNSSAINEQRFDQLLARFPGRTPDYLVTIGSQVSIFAHQKYLNKLPLVFIGVGSPQKSGLLPADDNDRSNRGNIAGVMYGLDTKARMEFLSNLVTPEAGRRYRIGFICNRDYSQDCHVAEQVQAIAAANFENAHVSFPIIELTQPKLTTEAEQKADMFFGYYFLHTNMSAFLDATHKPIIGLNIQDARKGAVASTGNDDFFLGVLAAREVVGRNLIDHTPLHDIPLIRPNSAYFVINIKAAKNHGLMISKAGLRLAHEIIED